MNKLKLKQAQQAFFALHPEGFESESLKEISKKHKLYKHVDFAHEHLSPQALEDVEKAAAAMIKLVSRSSMVSVFEKPKFRDAVNSMSYDEKEFLVDGLRNLLFDDEAKGFHQILDVLTRYGIAKWTLITVFRCYYYPETDLLFKPTTVKNIIKHFELEGLEYKPRPSYDFFVKYRDQINKMRKLVDSSVSKSGAGFSGFLMMSMDILQNKES